eukprot:scaffold35741_cov75-Phaeocystis_antarctica.AAC.2
MQQAPAYPALGVTLSAGADNGAPLASLPASAHVSPAEAADGMQTASSRTYHGTLLAMAHSTDYGSMLTRRHPRVRARAERDALRAHALPAGRAILSSVPQRHPVLLAAADSCGFLLTMTLLTMTLLTMILLVLPAGAGARDGRSGVQLRLVLPCTFYVLTVHLLFTYCLLTMYSLASATRSPSSRTSSLSWVAAAAAETTAAASSAASAARAAHSNPNPSPNLGPNLNSAPESNPNPNPNPNQS